MRSFQIDPSLTTFPIADQVTNLCYSAREILGGYMEEPCDFDDGMNETAIVDQDNEGLYIHETTEIPLNPRQFLSMSNLPYVLDSGGDLLVPVTDAGYVALRAQPFPELTDSHEFGKSAEDDQLIFRVPSLGTKPAIFHGWTLTPASEIQRDDLRRLNQIEKLLNFMRFSLRDLVANDLETYEATYLSQVPRRNGGDMVDALLGKFFDD